MEPQLWPTEGTAKSPRRCCSGGTSTLEAPGPTSGRGGGTLLVHCMGNLRPAQERGFLSKLHATALAAKLQGCCLLTLGVLTTGDTRFGWLDGKLNRNQTYVTVHYCFDKLFLKAKPRKSEAGAAGSAEAHALGVLPQQLLVNLQRRKRTS